MTIKNIIREVPPENTDLSYFFDDDGLTEAGGDYCYNLFIPATRRAGGFNTEEYDRIERLASDIFDDFEQVRNGGHWGGFKTYKEVMQYWGIPYSPTKCHALKEWAESNSNSPEHIAEFLTIKTGKQWAVDDVCGYCQGDYCDVVYCVEHHSNPRIYGEVWLGCAKEFFVIDLDDDGNECDSCGGYIVADCEAKDDADYKRLVCDWACINEDETQLEMFDCYVHTAHYRTA